MINSMKQVTNDIESKIVELYNNGFGTMELTKKFDTTKNIINKILKKNNIELRKKSSRFHISKQRELEVMELYNDGFGTMEIVNKCNIGRGYIQRILKRNNILLRKKSPKSHYDINFFSNYTPESCYWAGFIAADGNLSKSRNAMTIKLSNKDKLHLQKFSNNISYSNEVWEKDNTCGITLTGEWCINGLINNFDIKPLKTFNISISTKIPKEFLNHYIRGYFDGDGCITITSCPTISFTSGSCIILEELIELFYNLGVRLKTKATKPVINNTTQAICYSGKNAKIILDWLYNNSTENLRLDRKYERYLNYFK